MHYSIHKAIIACIAGTAILTTAPARAAIISVNLHEFAGDVQRINDAETFGIASEGTVVGGWVNLQATVNATDLAFSDGSISTVDLTGSRPNGSATFNGAYANTPLQAGSDDYTGTVNPTSVTLTDLSTNFPNGYKVIVYVGGYNGSRGASISDGTSTYYYQAMDSPVAPVTFVQTTDMTDDGDDTAPEAQYAVFGDLVLLTNDTLTLTIDTLYGGGSGLCGFQLVGQTPGDLLKRTWVGNVNSDWDAATLNWTNQILGATNYAAGDLVILDDTAVAGSPSVNLTGTRSPGSLTVDGTKNYTLTGSDIAGATGLSKKGSGTLTLNNANTYSGNTVVSSGTLKVGTSGVIPDGAGKGDVSVAAGATLDLSGVSEGINGLSGAGTIDNYAAGNATLTVGNDNDDMVFTGVLQSSVGALSLVKTGTNALELTGTGTHTHSGATIVQEGAMRIDPASSFSGSSALVVSNGATLTVSVTNGFGGMFPASVSLNGGVALVVEYGDVSTTGFTTPITTFGSLNLNGVTQIDISGAGFAVGTYTLISYSSKIGAGSISSTPASLPPGMVATITDSGSSIDLVVTFPSIQTLLWTQGDGDWATNGAFNWNLGAAEYLEYSPTLGDAVEFDNSNFGTVNLLHDVHPYSVTVAGNYTLTGSGRITGAVGIERTGNNATTFILDNTNTYTGVTTVSQGTLQINNAAALGSTNGETEVVTGGSLALGSGVTLSAEPLTLSGNGTGSNLGALRSLDTNSPVTVASPITLAANARIRAVDGGQLIITSPITDNGSNYTLFLHAGQSNTIVNMNSSGNVAGQVTVYGFTSTRGIIRFGVDDVFPGSELNVGGGLHDLNGTSQQFTGLDDGFAPQNGVITNSSASPSTVTITGTNSTQLLSPIRGNVSLVKNGAGLQSFGGGNSIVHTYSGTTTVNEGILGIASDLAGVTNTFTVNSGGTLRGANTVGGAVTVAAGGTIYAGFASNQVDTLDISNDLSLAGDVIVALNKDEAQSNDVINVTGTLTYGGTLTILNLGTNALVAGDTFTVFPTGGGGSFSSIDSSNVPGATFSFLDGVITVDSVSAIQPDLMASVSGGNITFSWDDTGGPFSLEAQTNTLSVGLSTNWAPYPDGTNGVSVPINSANPTVFFRLSN